MPQQETFLKKSAGSIAVEVVKIYDPHYAREVFDQMEDAGKRTLAEALRITEKYAQNEIPDLNELGYDEFLWEELNEDSLEDPRQSPRQYSFFVVNICENGKSQDCYVSSDWPSAEQFANAQLSGQSKHA